MPLSSVCPKHVRYFTASLRELRYTPFRVELVSGSQSECSLRSFWVIYPHRIIIFQGQCLFLLNMENDETQKEFLKYLYTMKDTRALKQIDSTIHTGETAQEIHRCQDKQDAIMQTVDWSCASFNRSPP